MLSASKLCCPICSEIYSSTDIVYSTTCGHIYHFHCMQKWKSRSTSCPQCREYNPGSHKIYLNFETDPERDENMQQLNIEKESYKSLSNDLERKLRTSETEFLQLQAQYNDNENEIKHLKEKNEYLRIQNDGRNAKLTKQVENINKLQLKLNDAILELSRALQTSSVTVELNERTTTALNSTQLADRNNEICNATKATETVLMKDDLFATSRCSPNKETDQEKSSTNANVPNSLISIVAKENIGITPVGSASTDESLTITNAVKPQDGNSKFIFNNYLSKPTFNFSSMQKNVSCTEINRKVFQFSDEATSLASVTNVEVLINNNNNIANSNASDVGDTKERAANNAMTKKENTEANACASLNIAPNTSKILTSNSNNSSCVVTKQFVTANDNTKVEMFGNALAQNCVDSNRSNSIFSNFDVKSFALSLAFKENPFENTRENTANTIFTFSSATKTSDKVVVSDTTFSKCTVTTMLNKSNPNNSDANSVDNCDSTNLSLYKKEPDMSLLTTMFKKFRLEESSSTALVPVASSIHTDANNNTSKDIVQSFNKTYFLKYNEKQNTIRKIKNQISRTKFTSFQFPIFNQQCFTFTKPTEHSEAQNLFQFTAIKVTPPVTSNVQKMQSSLESINGNTNIFNPAFTKSNHPLFWKAKVLKIYGYRKLYVFRGSVFVKTHKRGVPIEITSAAQIDEMILKAQKMRK